MVFFDSPVTERTNCSIIGVLPVGALSTGQEGINPLAGEWIVVKEWLQANPIKPYRLWRDALPA